MLVWSLLETPRKKIFQIIQRKQNMNSRINYSDEISPKHAVKDELGLRQCRSMIDEMLMSDMSPEEILIEVNTIVAAVKSVKRMLIL